MGLSRNAIERRAKRFLLQRSFELFVPTAPGFEPVTLGEVAPLTRTADAEQGGIRATGGLDSIYDLNLRLRTGNRVLLRLGEFLAQSYPMLYDHARTLPWEVLLGDGSPVTVAASAAGSRLRHMDHIASVVLDAVRSRLTELGLDVGPADQVAHADDTRSVADAPLRILARLHQDRCTLSLDTSGEHLHKRGYRRAVLEAPMRETLAAALLILADAADHDVILDPFSGSGTFAIEADALVRNAPPGAARHFAVERMPIHRPGTLAHRKRLALADARDPKPVRILASDIDTAAVRAAVDNARRAGAVLPTFRQADALTLDLDELLAPDERGLVVANVPYGVRLADPGSARRLAHAFLERLASSHRAWDFMLVSPRLDLAGYERIRVKRRVRFRTGGLDVVAMFGEVD